MTEPKRVTEAELASYERLSYKYEGTVGSVIRTLVDNTRRLRALIEDSRPGPLVAEAKAIRRERSD